MGHKDLLILHGWGKGSASYQKFIEEWPSEAIKLHIPDLPGFGKNTDVKSSFEIDDYVEWVHNYVKDNTTTPIILYGHSFGGKVAAKFTQKYPKLVEKLIFCESNVFKEPLSLRQKILKYIARVVKKLGIKKPLKLPRILVASSDYQNASEIMKVVFRNALRDDFSDVLISIKTDCLIIWGTDDKYLPVRNADKMHKLLEKSKVVLIKQCGHLPHVTHTERLQKEILEWIG